LDIQLYDFNLKNNVLRQEFKGFKRMAISDLNKFTY
jgi:hypothetical protein